MYNLAVWIPDRQGTVYIAILKVRGGVGNVHNVERMDDEGEGQSGDTCR